MSLVLSLRAITREDTANIIKWRNSPSVKKNLYLQDELKIEQHLSYLDNVVFTGKCAQYIIEIDDESFHRDIGTVFIKNIDRESKKGEFGIFIGEDDERGKGYSKIATRDILKIAFEQLALNRVYLSVIADNTPAVKAYLSAGFVIEGTLKEDFFRNGVYDDVIIMGITKSMWNH